MQAYERTKLYDLAAALPLFAFYGWSAWTDWAPFVADVQKIGLTGWDVASAADVLVRALTLVFVGTLVVLLFLRKVPTAKSDDLFPRLAAVCGTFASMAFIPMHTANLQPTLLAFSTLLIAAGTFATIVAFAWLGRSFSIMPEARGLVTRGPYRLVRHPAYLFEELTLFGIMLQHVQPLSAMLLMVQFAFQLARIHYEEEVLSASFPEYRAYAARTFRLIPGVY